MHNAWRVYDLMLDGLSRDVLADKVIVGQRWSLCRGESHGYGFSMTPLERNPGLVWPGTLRGRTLSELATWIRQTEPYQAAIGQAAINASINHQAFLANEAVALTATVPTELKVFEHFYPQLVDKQVVVIGEYPHLKASLPSVSLTVLDLQGRGGQLLDSASRQKIENADWVFLGAHSLANKTFPEYAELAADANLVLMGPSTPWLPELAEFGVDYLAGVCIRDEAKLEQIVVEGGGSEIFKALEYCVVDIGEREMSWIKTAISDTVMQRERIKKEMEKWYTSRNQGRFPGLEQLTSLDAQLSVLDSQFKRLWDARH